jgi:hypothetical protein
VNQFVSTFVLSILCVVDGMFVWLDSVSFELNPNKLFIHSDASLKILTQVSFSSIDRDSLVSQTISFGELFRGKFSFDSVGIL